MLFNIMKGSMGRVVRKQYKITNAIIVSYVIDMMNNFRRLEVATNMLFHNKTVFKNVINPCRIRMIRRKDIDIFVTNKFSTFPIMILISFFETTRIRFADSFSSFVPNRFRSFINSTRHSILQSKSLCSACLEVTAKLLTHTKRQLLTIKNLLPLSNTIITQLTFLSRKEFCYGC